MSGLLRASPEEIRRYARGALEIAGAIDATPVPLELVERAVGLYPSEALWAAGEEMPPGMLEILRKLKRKVVGGLAFAEKRVYLDFDQPIARRRFIHGHELGHKVLPWQERAYFTDDDYTLAPETRDAMESEANMFSAELLFGLDRFTAMADDYAPGVVAPLELNGSFGVSAHAALRRYVATSRHNIALLALGRRQVGTAMGNALPVMAGQCAHSASFADRYGLITEVVAGALPLSEHPALAAIARAPSTTVIQGGGGITLDTKRGLVTFEAESFTNGRLNFVVVFRRHLFSGRRLKVAS